MNKIPMTWEWIDHCDVDARGATIVERGQLNVDSSSVPDSVVIQQVFQGMLFESFVYFHSVLVPLLQSPGISAESLIVRTQRPTRSFWGLYAVRTPCRSRIAVPNTLLQDPLILASCMVSGQSTLVFKQTVGTA